MPDQLRACDLDDRHVDLRIRVAGHEGILLAVGPVDDTHVQLLLAVPGMPPQIPTVGAGAPVELLN